MVRDPVEEIRVLLPGGDLIVPAVQGQKAPRVDAPRHLLVDVHRCVGDQEGLVHASPAECVDGGLALAMA